MILERFAKLVVLPKDFHREIHAYRVKSVVDAGLKSLPAALLELLEDPPEPSREARLDIQGKGRLHL